MPRRLRADMSHALANKTTTQQYQQCNIKPCIFKGYIFSGVFIIRRIIIQRPSIHLRWQGLSADEHCSSSSIAMNLASFVTESSIEKNPDRVAVLIHRDNFSAGVGDSLLRLQWKRTPLCLFETKIFSNKIKVDSQWRSAHRVIPCRAWVVKYVVVEHIRYCNIAGTRRTIK